MSLVGKFVCWGNKDGQFCWGKIKSETQINTVHGKKDAVVLTDRLMGPVPGRGIMRLGDRDTILRLDMINVETDIFDRDTRQLDAFNDEELFILAMGGFVTVGGDTHLGVRNLLLNKEGQQEVMDQAAKIMQDRLGIKSET